MSSTVVTRPSVAYHKPRSIPDYSATSWCRLLPHNLSDPINLEHSKTKYTVGRCPTSDVVLLGSKISKQHCEIHLSREADGTPVVELVDLSSNGSYVNGTKVGKGKHCQLGHADLISLGGPFLWEGEFSYYVRIFSPPVVPETGFKSRYVAGEIVGRGLSGTIRRAWTRGSGQPVAVKIISKREGDHNRTWERTLRRDLARLQDAQDPSPVHLIECFDEDSAIFVVIEWDPEVFLGIS